MVSDLTVKRRPDLVVGELKEELVEEGGEENANEE